MARLVVPRTTARDDSVLLDDVLSNAKLEGVLADAGLPADLKQVIGGVIVMARKKWGRNNTVTSCVLSADISVEHKSIVLFLSASRFLAGNNPRLWFDGAAWKLTVSEGANNKEHHFDDIEFAIL